MQIEEKQFQEFRPVSNGRKQVFIVDDDKSVCRALKTLMLAYGFIVRTYCSAEEFFSAIPNDFPGCLILDIQMPGLNGWEAHQRLLKSGSTRPVILLTADKSDGLEEKSKETGATGFFQKPVNDHELVALVNQMSIN